MDPRTLATTTSLVATGLLAGCYVVPIDPRYPVTEQPPLAVAGKTVPAALPQGGATNLQARLYPLNDIAGGMGPLTVTLADSASGHAGFSLTYAGELLQGEASRVGPNYPGHRERGRARGTYVNCEYAMTASNRGAGACLFSNSAKYQVHFGS